VCECSVEREVRRRTASENESSDEVDVVSVPRHDTTQPSGRRETSSSSTLSTQSVVRELLVLPPACSLLARVTAMHNYSSSTRSTGGGMYSAPQSPTSARQRPDRRCFSTPASPSPTSGRRLGGRRGRRRRAAACDWSASDDSDSGGSSAHLLGHPGKQRTHHNVLERRRRDHLKYSFEALRAVVPGSASDVRIPKVAILRRARDHVRNLANISQKLYAEYWRLSSVRERWVRKLALLTADNDQLSTVQSTHLCSSLVKVEV